MAMIPAMTTGMMDFMIKSGLATAMDAIPVPDLAVPYAAPRATITPTQSFTRYKFVETEQNKLG